MGMEVGELSSIELSEFERLVAWETLIWEGDGSKKSRYCSKFRIHQKYVDVGLRSRTWAFWIGIGNLWSRWVVCQKQLLLKPRSG